MPAPEKLAMRVLRAALPDPLTIAPASDGRSNAVIRLPDDTRIPLQLRWAGAGFPRDVERALRDVSADGEVPLVIAARSLSPGGRSILESAHANWVTETAAARLHLGSVIVERAGTVPSLPDDADGTTHWTRAIAEVAEVILADAARNGAGWVPSTTSLASRSGRSQGSVTAALQQFDRECWTEPGAASRGPSARRHLADARAMLDSWAPWASRSARLTRYHSVHREPARIADAIRAAFPVEAAFGGRFAADSIAPFSSSLRTVRCWIDGEVDDRARDERLAAAGIERSDESGRVEVLAGGRSIMSAAELRDGYLMVSPVRVYADLLPDGVRGADAAEHLRDTVIGF